MLDYTKPEPITLKDHPEFTEKWLAERIEEDTTILGLGELVVIERERRQEKAGRLDFLLADPEANLRYEVELQLGATDESHIIRCIEYWDIERRRYPGYDHCAVIVAEDVTSRFLNILGLFAGNIPLIAIQLNALKVGNQIVLDFVRVLDAVSLRRDDESDAQAAVTDRVYWQSRVPAKMIEMVDDCLTIINEKASAPVQLNYNKYYIGLQDNTRSRLFVYFKPKKQFTHICAQVSDKQPWLDRLDEAGLAATVERRCVRVTVSPKDMTKHRELLTELLHKAVDEYEQ